MAEDIPTFGNGVRSTKREEIKGCILRAGGTNCDAETKRAFEALGAQARVVHMNEFGKNQSLLDHNALVFPRGFSCGDYVRAGATKGQIDSS